MTKRQLENFEKFYDTQIDIMTVHRTKGALMKEPTKQSLKDEISRQKEVINELMNTINEKEKEFNFLHKLHISILQKMNEVKDKDGTL
jgi:hypothetical protein